MESPQVETTRVAIDDLPALWGERFQNRKRLEGESGIIFGVDLQTKQDVIIKYWDPSKYGPDDPDQAERADVEMHVYRTLSEIEKQKKDADPNYLHVFPTLLQIGVEKTFPYMALERVGPTFKDASKRFPPKIDDIVRSIPPLVRALQMIHEIGYIFRGCHRENFLMNYMEHPINGFRDRFYVIDFERCTPYMVNGKHIESGLINEDIYYFGRKKFATITAHHGHRLSRKDDMEALFYVISREACGHLPWHNSDSNEVRLQRKLEWINSDFRELPAVFKKFIEHVNGLGYSDTPDYDYLCDLCSDPQ